MKNNLIERYLYAVSRELPEKIRTDVQEELRSLIMDMAEEQCMGGEITEDIMLRVLEELGHPTDMADKYQPEGSRSLISMPYYADYIFVLKIVLGCVLAGTVLSWITGMVFSATIEGAATYVTAAVEFSGGVFSGLCAAFTFVTLLFAGFQRTGVAVNIRKSTVIKDLPDIPHEKAHIKKSDAALEIIFGVLFPVVFLMMPEKLGYLRASDGEVAYLFNTGNIRSVWYLLIAIAVLAVLQGIMALYEGRYTKRYAVVRVLTNVISVVLFAIFWLNREIFHPTFISHLNELFAGKNVTLIIPGNFRLLIFTIVAAVTIIESITAIWKAWKYDR